MIIDPELSQPPHAGGWRVLAAVVAMVMLLGGVVAVVAWRSDQPAPDGAGQGRGGLAGHPATIVVSGRTLRLVRHQELVDSASIGADPGILRVYFDRPVASVLADPECGSPLAPFAYVEHEDAKSVLIDIAAYRPRVPLAPGQPRLHGTHQFACSYLVGRDARKARLTVHLTAPLGSRQVFTYLHVKYGDPAVPVRRR